MTSKDVGSEPLRSIIRNCRRLIADAELLLQRGSAASALSLALMAFEEAGKGHGFELDAGGRSKKIRSSHQARQLMSALVLMSSLHQKYGLKWVPLSEEEMALVEERLAAAKDFSAFAAEPAPDVMRARVGAEVFAQFDMLPHDKRLVAVTELNWLRKVTKSAATGELERLRQSGFYLDFGSDSPSDPSDITTSQAYRWIWTAQRSVNLLQFGLYFQPYSELAAYLEACPKPLPEPEEMLRGFKLLAAEAKKPRENNKPTSHETEKPYPPFTWVEIPPIEPTDG